jgi:histidinol-phosphatase
VKDGAADRNVLAGLLDFSIDLAVRAGEIVLPHFLERAAPERKPDGSFVTAADRAAETFMRERIAQAYPDDAILGEEFGATQGSSGRRWILDPIDGTFSFVHGVPLFGVLIGVEYDGCPNVGVAHFPALGDTIAAARGHGCRLNGASVRVSRAAARLADALVVSNDPAAADDLIRGARKFRGWGDCYGYMLVASGRADVAFDPVVSEWDCAALAPIVEEAGGTFTDWRGERTTRGGNAVATNGALFDEVIEALSPARRASGRSGS